MKLTHITLMLKIQITKKDGLSMKKIGRENIEDLFALKNMMVSGVAIVILSWAFVHNQLWGKLVICPFFICSTAAFLENLFWLLHKEKISNIFHSVFRISLFIFILGFLIYTVYYSVINKQYSLLLIVAIFAFFGLRFFKKK